MTSHSDSYRFNGRQIITNEWQLLPLMPLVVAFRRSVSNEASGRAVISDLNHLVATLGQPSKLLLGDYTREAITAYVEKRLETRSPTTLCRHLATYRKFDKWLAAAIPGFPMPAHVVSMPTPTIKAFEGITHSQAEALIAAAYKIGTTDAIRLRNGIACELLYSTGLRAAEALSLTHEQLSSDGRWFKHVRCKGGKYRDVYLPKFMDESFYRWMLKRRELLNSWRIRKHHAYPIIIPVKPPASHAVEEFILDPKSLWRIVNDAATAAGIHSVHPHTLRHAFAHELLDTTKDIRFVAQALGHSDVKTTMRYTERTHDKIANLIEQSMRRNGTERSGLSEEAVSRGDSAHFGSSSSTFPAFGRGQWD